MLSKNTGKRKKSQIWIGLLAKIRSLPFFPVKRKNSIFFLGLLGKLGSLPFLPCFGELFLSCSSDSLKTGSTALLLFLLKTEFPLLNPKCHPIIRYELEFRRGQADKQRDYTRPACY